MTPVLLLRLVELGADLLAVVRAARREPVRPHWRKRRADRAEARRRARAVTQP